jgi:hypothetical protein
MLPFPDHVETRPFAVKKNGDGNRRTLNGGNGHHRRVRPQIRHGYRHAARKADTALLLVEATGMSEAEAIERCSTNPAAFYAMKALREAGSTTLYNAVLRGGEPMRTSWSHVRNAAAAISAFKKCSRSERGLFRLATGATNDPVAMLLNLNPDQLVATSKSLGLDWIWDKLIAAAMEAAETTAEPMAVNGNGGAAVTIEELTV